MVERLPAEIRVERLDGDLIPGRFVFGALIVKSVARVTSECSVLVGWVDPVIVVRREVADDDCALRHIMAHERGHISIYRDAENDVASWIRASASSGAGLGDAAIAAIERVRSLQDAHDNDEELSSNRRACRGRLASMARSGG